jgi:hypothetical protein
MTEWAAGVTAYFKGEYRKSLAHLDAAERLMPGFPDIQRLRASVQMKVDKTPRFMRRGKTVGLGIGLALMGVLAVLGLRTLMRNRVHPGPTGIQRVGAEEIRRRLEAGSGVALVDARHGAAFDDTSVQAAGAVRYDIDHPDLPALQVQVKPDGEVIAYCD